MKKRITGLLLSITFILVSISLTMVPISAEAISDEGRIPFFDVKPGAWFEDEVTFCYLNHIVNGISEHTFDPDGKLTRGMFVVMLAGAVGADLSVYEGSTFEDVADNSWYAKAIEWAYQNEYVDGISKTVKLFAPDNEITREQICTMFMRYMTKIECNVTVDPESVNKFDDLNEISDWALDAVIYAVSAGLVNGVTETTMEPSATATRAVGARLFTLFMRNFYYSGCEHELSQPTCTEPSACTLCGMVDSLPLGHLTEVHVCQSWDKPCLRCGERIPYAPHTDHFGPCDRCGEFENNVAKISYYMKQYGLYDSDTGDYYMVHMDRFEDVGESCIVYMKYHHEAKYDYVGLGDRITLETVYVFSDGSYDVTSCELDWGMMHGTNNITFNYALYDKNGYNSVSGKAQIENVKITPDTQLSLSSYSGRSEFKAAANEYATYGLHASLNIANYWLDAMFGGTVAEMGFVNY